MQKLHKTLFCPCSVTSQQTQHFTNILMIHPRPQLRNRKSMHPTLGNSNLQTHKTLRQTLMNVKNCIPEEKKREVAYEVPCKECPLSYVGEMKRTVRVRIGEYKQAVKRGDLRNSIDVHAHQSQYVIDWDGAKVKRSVS